jgi:hypothetical protein
MNWKSTAAATSVTLLAGWLGWTPMQQSAGSGVPAAPSGAPSVETLDIQQQAARLQTRVRAELGYSDPKRNPFRFNVRPAPPPSSGPSIGTAVAMPTPVVREVLPFTLSGMAADNVEGQLRRTAILTTSSDVLFANEGDTLGNYTVTRIDETGVEMTASDGTMRRLTLTP